MYYLAYSQRKPLRELFDNFHLGADKMAQQMKILATRPHDISWISQTHRFEWEERTLTPKSPVTSTSIFLVCP